MENKKAYIKPVLESETFIPQVYCKNCAAEPGITKYYFECNAGYRHKQYDVITDAGVNLTKDYWTPFGDVTNYYHPCKEKHEAYSNDEFLHGWLCESDGNDDKIKWANKTKIIIWTDGGNDVHCTTNLDMEHWETVKS